MGVSAEAVTNSLDAQDLKEDRTVPHPDKIRTVGLNVATAVVLEAQKMGLAGKTLGKDSGEVKAALETLMWSPPPTSAGAKRRKLAPELSGALKVQAPEEDLLNVNKLMGS